MNHQNAVQPTSVPVFEVLEPRWLLAAVFPTAYEQYLVELINRARANPVAEATRDGIDLNAGLAANTISSSSKQPLAINPFIVDAAERHTNYLFTVGTLDHTGSGGSTPSSRVVAAGYSLVSPSGVGENLALDPSPSSTEAGLDAIEQALFVDSADSGRSHRINLLFGTYREVGTGVVRGVWNGTDTVVATQDFAYSGSSIFLTGVVYDDTLAKADSFYTPGEGLGNVKISAVRWSDKKVFTTTTWTAGGYTMALPVGVYDITASGGSLANSMQSLGVSITSVNVKVDFQGQKAGQWKQVGSFGGLTSAITDVGVDPTNSSHLLISTREGLYQSTDSGAHWTLVQPGFVRQLAFDPQDSTHVLAALGGTSGGILESTNGGGTWTLNSTGMTHRDVAALAIAATSSNILYAGDYSQGIVARSIDSGVTWSDVLDARTFMDTTSNVYVRDLFTSADGQTVYALCGVVNFDSGYVLKSADGGSTWTQCVTPVDNAATALAMDPGNSQTLYVGGTGGIHRSTDGGGTWGASGTNLPSTAARSLLVDAQNPYRLYAGVGGVVYTTASWGATWQPLGTALTSRNDDSISSLAIDASNPLVVYAAVFRSSLSDALGAEEGLYFTTRAAGSGPVTHLAYRGGQVTDGQAAAVNLGTLLKGAMSPGVSFTIRNDGDEPLIITSTFATYTHFTVTNPSKSTLLPDEIATFTIAMKTDTKGTFTQALSFTSNDTTRSPFDFTVTGQVTQPDLSGAFPAGAFSTVAVPGDTLHVPLILTNLGDATASGTISVAFYLSTDPGFGTQTPLPPVPTVSISVAAATSKTYTLAVKVPTDLAAGDYYVRAVIDSTNVINESNESNNTVTSTETQTVAWQFGTFDGRRNASLMLEDFLGNPVVFALSGNGYGEVTGNDAAGFTLEFTDTDNRTSVKVMPPSGQETTLDGVTVHGSLGSFTAKTVNLDGGDFTVEGSLGSLTLDDVGNATITITSSAPSTTSAALSFNRVTETGVDSNLSIKSITANEWLETDTVAEVITAPTLGSLTINMKKATSKTPATSGDFEADLKLFGPAASATSNVLGNVTIGGHLTSSHWDVAGKAGNVTVKGDVDDWDWGADPGSLVTTAAGSLKLGDVDVANVLLGGPIGAVTAIRWQDGLIQATQGSSIKITGLKGTISGDFGAELQLTQGTLVGATPVLKSLTVAGWMDGASILSAGPLGTITVGGMRSSTLWAGIKDGVTGMPDDATDFNIFTSAKGAAVNGIGSFTIKGIAGQTDLFIDSTVASWTMGTVVLKGVQVVNVPHPGTALGVSGHYINSYKHDPLSLPKLTGPQVVEQDGDFIVNLLL